VDQANRSSMVNMDIANLLYIVARMTDAEKRKLKDLLGLGQVQSG